MNITRGLTTNKDQPITSPFPQKTGLFIEFRAGDFCHPLGEGNWFKPPYFDKVLRSRFTLTDSYLLAICLMCISTLSIIAICLHGSWWWLTSIFVPAPLFNPGMFISWRFGKHGGYIGAKAYGVDSPEYKNWLPTNEVYEGSQAIMFSIRPHANLV